MKYVVVTTCYFGNRFYKKGEVVEFDSAANIPSHFEPIKEGKSVEEKPKKDKEKKAKGKEKNG